MSAGSTLNIPATAGRVRLHAPAAVPGLPGVWWTVAVSPVPAPPWHEGQRNNHVALTHRRGTDWPDPEWEEVAAATLRAGGMALLLFEGLQDALAFMERLGLGLPDWHHA